MRRALPAGLLVSVLALTRCGDTVVAISPPEDAAPNAPLLIAVESDAGSRLFALAAGEALRVFADGDARVTLLEYAEPWSDLPIAPGELRSVEGGCVLLEELPPRRSYVLRVAREDRMSSAWSPVSSKDLSGFVRLFRIDTGTDCRSDRCREWETTALEFPGSTEGIAWGVRHSDGRALFGTFHDEVYTVDETRTVRRVAVEPSSATIRSASVGSDGRLWIGGLYHVYRAALSEDRLSLEAITAWQDDVYGYLAGGTSTAAEGLFTLTDRGRFLRRTGSDWTSIGGPLSPSTGLGRRGGLALVRPGEAVAVWGHDPIVWRFRDGELLDETPVELTQGGSAIAHLPGWGTVFGTGDGSVFDDHEGSFELRSERLPVPVRAIAGLSDGYMLGGESGAMQQYFFDRGFCPAFTAIAGGVRALVALGPGLLLVGGSEIGSESRASGVILARRE
ncbi:MAG: PQQ-like beta-propeller repeat protein [Deltaproteobacteria bacterium]|nr:PQQ-like beta-propeller repeat protein [Deltaproteobacteria bacterium]